MLSLTTSIVGLNTVTYLGSTSQARAQPSRALILINFSPVRDNFPVWEFQLALNLVQTWSKLAQTQLSRELMVLQARPLGPFCQPASGVFRVLVHRRQCLCSYESEPALSTGCCGYLCCREAAYIRGAIKRLTSIAFNLINFLWYQNISFWKLLN